MVSEQRASTEKASRLLMADLGCKSMATGDEEARHMHMDQENPELNLRYASTVSSFSCELPPAAIQHNVCHKLVVSN